MYNKKQKALVRKLFKDYFGYSDLNKIRKYLKSKAKFQYGCFYYKENIGAGVELTYTSNSNCFASYLISVQGVGMVSSDALQAKDITRAGRQRGCDNLYAL